MTQKEAMRDLQIDLYWKQLSCGMQELIAAQNELHDRLGRILRPEVPRKGMPEPDPGAEDLCQLACDLMRVRDDIQTQLRVTVDILERLEL
jgi:hypothetical protein